MHETTKTSHMDTTRRVPWTQQEESHTIGLLSIQIDMYESIIFELGIGKENCLTRLDIHSRFLIR